MLLFIFLKILDTNNLEQLNLSKGGFSAHVAGVCMYSGTCKLKPAQN